MTTRQRNATILALIVLAAGGSALVLGNPKGKHALGITAPASVLDAVPDDSFLVLTMSVPELRASPLAAPLVKVATSLGGMSNAEKECGFDPFAQVAEIAVAVPEETTGDIGVVVRGTFDSDELVKCARKVITARGGSPVVRPSTEHPSFTLIEESFALGEKPTLALRPGGPLLVGKGAWLGKMMDAADGKRPALQSNAKHMALRTGIGSRSVVATVLLPAALRNRLRGEMADEIGGGESSAMSGVLGVDSAAFGLSAGAPGTTTELTAELHCDSADACSRVRALVEKKRVEFSKDITFRFIGLGPLFDALTVAAEGPRLTATTRMPAEDARQLIERLLELRRGRAPRPPTPAPGPSATPPKRDGAEHAGEVISAKKEAGAGR